MAWTKVTYACGHEGFVQMYGKASDREWKAEQYKNRLCPGCLEEERQKENEESAAWAKAQDLPELRGTPKQIAWAETIRKEALEIMDSQPIEEVADAFFVPSTKLKKTNERRAEKGMNTLTAEEIKSEFAARLAADIEQIHQQDSASWWIDHRGLTTRDGQANRVRRISSKLKNDLDNLDVQAETEEYVSVVEPENRKYDGAVDLQIEGDQIRASYQKDKAFRQIARWYHMHWNGTAWTKKPIIGEASLTDAAADLSNRLLCAGFRVKFHDPIIKDLAVSGQFTPGNPRIAWLEDKYIRIRIGDEDTGIQELLDGICYPKRDYEVVWTAPRKSWEKVYDLLQNYDFAISKDLQKLFDDKKRAIVTKVTPAKAKPATGNYLEDILNSSREVIEDLKDED